MTHKKRFGRALVALELALLVIAGACSNKSNSPPKLSYSTDLKELRDRFNKDKGKVRLLLILSPT
jgi:hypothetical protein